MAFSSGGRTQSSLAEINITPLVDVVLVLLLIFMLTAPVLQSGIEVAVPQTRTVNQLTEERTVVTIDREQRVFFAGQARKPRGTARSTAQQERRSDEKGHLPASRW